MSIFVLKVILCSDRAKLNCEDISSFYKLYIFIFIKSISG